METPTIIKTDNNNQHVVNGPLTTSAIRDASPDLLTNEIDSRVVRIRPMATPIDQISRMIGARSASSMVVDYYSVDTRPISSTIVGTAENIEGIPENQFPRPFMIHTANDRLFAATETLMFPGLHAGKTKSACEPLVVYVQEVVTGYNPGLRVVALNQNPEEVDSNMLPGIGNNMEVVRMGRAAAELDVQTPQFEALPTKSQNFCQIFKVQIEQSNLARQAAKEVGWTLADQEEVAIMDMRLGMEKSFIFGRRLRLSDPEKYDEVLFTEGIWHQAGGEIDLTLEEIDTRKLLEVMKQAFTGEAAGSSRKILVAGSDLVLALNALETTRVLLAGDSVTRWGIDFNEIKSKFGSLYVVHSEVFDQCGRSKDGMIIDPEYLTKYSHLPMRVETLDLKNSGQRNTQAIVATEASCLVLRHPKTHFRIIGA
ncbi:MAG: DUF5309 family protein [Bacteroides sp.]|nr:DUF5309 family protein [Bacteroides sp.]MCM1413543.1 DUF5309 family protein [Bacteroides sp.]MCM1471097.1 DUF5309 family protein [Bacteroides sp.]